MFKQKLSVGDDTAPAISKVKFHGRSHNGLASVIPLAQIATNFGLHVVLTGRHFRSIMLLSPCCEQKLVGPTSLDEGLWMLCTKCGKRSSYTFEMFDALVGWEKLTPPSLDALLPAVEVFLPPLEACLVGAELATVLAECGDILQTGVDPRGRGRVANHYALSKDARRKLKALNSRSLA